MSKYPNLNKSQIERIAAILGEGKGSSVTADFTGVQTLGRSAGRRVAITDNFTYVRVAKMIRDNKDLQAASTSEIIIAAHNQLGETISSYIASRALQLWKEGKI